MPTISLRPTQEWLDAFYEYCASIRYLDASDMTIWWARCISNKPGEPPIRFADGWFTELETRDDSELKRLLEG